MPQHSGPMAKSLTTRHWRTGSRGSRTSFTSGRANCVGGGSTSPCRRYVTPQRRTSSYTAQRVARGLPPATTSAGRPACCTRRRTTPCSPSSGAGVPPAARGRYEEPTSRSASAEAGGSPAGETCRPKSLSRYPQSSSAAKRSSSGAKGPRSTDTAPCRPAPAPGGSAPLAGTAVHSSPATTTTLSATPTISPPPITCTSPPPSRRVGAELRTDPRASPRRTEPGPDRRPCRWSEGRRR